MEKLDFKTVNLAEHYDAIDKLNHKEVFIKMKCIFEHSKVKSNWDYANALFSTVDSLSEMMLGLIFMDEFPDGERYRIYKTIRNIKQAIGMEITKEYRVYFSKDNPYGWLDDNTFQPNVRVHKFIMLRIVHDLFRKHGHVSLLMALEHLQTTDVKTHSNWETMAILVMMWSDICHILGLKTADGETDHPNVFHVNLN